MWASSGGRLECGAACARNVAPASRCQIPRLPLCFAALQREVQDCVASMTIPCSAITRVKEAANLGTVAAAYLRLRPAGRDSLSAKCLWHGSGKERTSSLFVHPQAGYYKCFSCGVGGDVLDFICAVEHCAFPEAVRLLADRYGIAIEPSRYDAATERRARAYAAELAQEMHWWWSGVRLTLVRRQHTLVDIERRAEAWLAARVDAEDSPAVDYAWFWLVEAGRLWAEVQAQVDWIDGASADDLKRGYEKVRGKVRPRWARERAAWAVLREGLESEIRATEGAVAA